MHHKFPQLFVAESVFLAYDLAITCHEHMVKKSSKSELKKDVGNSHYEKAVPALCEGRKAPEINGIAGIVGGKKA